MKSANNYRIQGDSAYIALTDRTGQVVAETIVDVGDVATVSAYGRWRKGHSGYVYTFRTMSESGQRQDIALHRFLMSPPDGMVVDHINHDSLDNRRSNLRVLTRAENMQNRQGPVTGKLDPYRNVYRQPKGGGFAVRIRGTYFGTYRSVDEANRVATKMRPRVMAYSTT